MYRVAVCLDFRRTFANRDQSRAMPVKGYTLFIDPYRPLYACVCHFTVILLGLLEVCRKKKNRWEVEEETILIAEWEKFDQSKRRG